MSAKLLSRIAISCMAISVLSLFPSLSFSIAITNPGFEVDGNIDLTVVNATGWTDNLGSNDFYGEIWNTDWHTEGTHGVTLLQPTSGGFNLGDSAFLRQSVDLTGIDAILFDAQLSVHVDGAWENFLEADFYIDSVKKWSNQTIGTYLDQSIDTTGLIGMHTLEISLNAIAPGFGNGRSACWYEFDNVRSVPAVPEPSSIAMVLSGIFTLLFGRSFIRTGATANRR
jgi:hypothetical protein